MGFSNHHCLVSLTLFFVVIFAHILGENGSDAWRDDMSYRGMALDVLHALDERSLDRVVLVGHSMGGKVAQTLALLYPERVSGLVVLDMAPVAYTADEDPSWKAVQDIVTALTRITLQDPTTQQPYPKKMVDAQLATSIPDPALRAFVWTNIQPRTMQWKIPIGRIASQLDTLAGFDVQEKVPPPQQQQQQYTGDVLLINGGQSRFVRHAYMDTIASYFPNHMLTTIRGAGHWVHAEAPDDTLALLKKYLDR